MNKYNLDSLNRLINYVYDDEARNFEEANEEDKKEHIFNDIKIITGWIDKEMKERKII